VVEGPEVELVPGVVGYAEDESVPEAVDVVGYPDEELPPLGVEVCELDG
jgi:hypothetical protein